MAVIRRIKQKISGIVKKKQQAKAVKAIKTVKVAPIKKSKVPLAMEAAQTVKEKKDVIGLQETMVGKTKFYIPPSSKMKKPVLPHDLPGAYDKDIIVLQVRDPWWLYTYWEVVHGTWERLKAELKEIFFNARKVLRVYDVTNINFKGDNAHRYFDIEVGLDSINWYINTAGPGRSWCVDLGLRLPDNRFITIVRSNIVNTPFDGPSSITDEEWMIPEEMFARLYGLGFGFGQSSPVGKVWMERMKQALFSGALASPGMASMASPVKKIPKERKFWLVVDCELIVYGATEPDAKVTVQGRPIKLRPDGTFSFRYALPDGQQVIPVHAVSNDQIEERTITPIVTRKTKTNSMLNEAKERELKTPVPV